MTPRLQTSIVVAALALSLCHASEVKAQVAHYTHGAAEGGQVMTNRSEVSIGPVNSYAQLTSTALTMELQPGDSDLFVLEFDAECIVSGGPEDYLSVQARLNGFVGLFGAGGSFLQPQSNPTDLQACTGSEGRHTISKSWVVRLSNTTSTPQSHTFSIWVRLFDAGEQNLPYSLLDNRIVRVTRYN